MGMLRPIRRILVGRSRLEIGSLVLGGRPGATLGGWRTAALSSTGISSTPSTSSSRSPVPFPSQLAAPEDGVAEALRRDHRRGLVEHLRDQRHERAHDPHYLPRMVDQAVAAWCSSAASPRSISRRDHRPRSRLRRPAPQAHAAQDRAARTGGKHPDTQVSPKQDGNR